MSKKQYSAINMNSNKLTGLPTPTTAETTAAANVQFVLDNAVDPALESRVTAIENKSSSIFTTFTDEFINGYYVDASTKATLENGYIRALFQNKYRDDFNNLDGIVQPNNSFYSQSGKIKRDTIASNTEHQFTTNAMTNFAGGVTQVSVTPSVTLSATNTFSSNVTNSSHTTASNIMPVKHNDVDNNEWTLRYSNAATATGGAYLSASHINSGAETRIWPTSGSATTVGDQPRNLSITSDNTYVYVAFYQTSLVIEIGMYNRSTGVRVGTNVVQSTGTSIGFRGQDLLVVGSKLFHLRTNNGSATANIAITVYSIGVGGLTQDNVFTTYTDSSGALHTCKLAYDSATNTILYTVFKRAATNAVIIGRRSVTNGSAVGSENVLVSTDSNGSGTAVFHNGVFRVITGSNANTAFNYFTVSTSGTVSGVLATSSAYSVSVYRFESVAFGNTLHVVYGNNAMTALLYTRFDMTSGFAPIDTNQLYSFTEVRRVHVFGVNSSSQSFKVIAEEYNTNYDVFTYQAISETLQIEIRNSANNGALSAKTTYTSGTLLLNLNTAVNDFRVRFYVQLASLIPLISSFEMEYFEVEATATNTQIDNPTSSDFVSTVIFNDRVVDTIFLSPIVSNESNGSFVWSVSTDDGTTWQSVTSLNQFVSVDAGSKVRVKATITRNSNVTSLADMPRIESYQFSTKNVITPNDLLPLQVNMLKMGLKLNALGTYSTTEFVKMMVDLFENANNIDSSSTAIYNSGTYTTAPSTSATLISQAENTQTNDNVATVTSAIVMVEYTGTVSFYVRRGNDSWGNPITLGEIVSFTQGTPTNEIQIKAEMSPGAVLYGWAYLYQ